MSLARSFSRQLIAAALKTGGASAKLPEGIKFGSVRAALYSEFAAQGIRGRFKVTGDEGVVSLTNREPDMSVLIEHTPVVTPSFTPVATPMNPGLDELVTTHHSPQLLAAFKVLIEHEVIVAVRILSLDEDTFNTVYGEYKDHFTVKPMEVGIQLL